jgi:hypothetical protein
LKGATKPTMMPIMAGLTAMLSAALMQDAPALSEMRNNEIRRNRRAGDGIQIDAGRTMLEGDIQNTLGFGTVFKVVP